jgi:hypothetical protein
MPQRDDPRHNLRMPPVLKAKLAHSAIDNNRSMNAEILARLEGSFAPDPAQLLVDTLRPLAAMNEADRARLAALLIEAGAILSAPTK